MNRRSVNTTLPRRRRRNRNAQTGTRLEVFDEKATITIPMAVGAKVGKIDIGLTGLENLIVSRYEQWRIASMTAKWVCPGGNQSPGVRSLIISRTHPAADSTALITTNGGKLVANSVPSVLSGIYRSDPNHWFGATDTAAFLRYSYDGVVTAMTSWIELSMTLHLRGYDSTVKGKVGQNLHNDVAPVFVNTVPHPNPDPIPNEGPPYTPNKADLVENLDKAWRHVIRFHGNQYDPLIMKETVDRAKVKNVVWDPLMVSNLQGAINTLKASVSLSSSSLQYLCAYVRFADAVLDRIIDMPRGTFEDYDILSASLGQLKLNVRPRGVPSLEVEEGVAASSEIEEISEDHESDFTSEPSSDPEVLLRLNKILETVKNLEDSTRVVYRISQETAAHNKKNPIWTTWEIRGRFLYTIANRWDFGKIELFGHHYFTPIVGQWALPYESLTPYEVEEYCDRLRARKYLIGNDFKVAIDRGENPPPNNSMFPQGHHPMLRYWRYKDDNDNDIDVPGAYTKEEVFNIVEKEFLNPHVRWRHGQPVTDHKTRFDYLEWVCSVDNPPAEEAKELRKLRKKILKQKGEDKPASDSDDE